MLHITEIHHSGIKTTWKADDENDFIEKIDKSLKGFDGVIYEQATPRELLKELADITPSDLEDLDQEDKEEWEDIIHLAKTTSWDTTHYRADFLTGCGVYSTKFISKYDAYVAYLSDDLQSLTIK
jgi:SPX domain protein involved in polyphosphate accumulation